MRPFFLLVFTLVSTLIAHAQSNVYSPVETKNIAASNFNFTKKWAYPWYMIKKANGKFENTTGGTTGKKDTSHLYFTANCQTNVMGGYKVRYCTATRNGDNIKLNFADGLPAYASEYLVYINKNQYYFEPKIIYADLVSEQKKTYRTTKSKLNIGGDLHKTKLLSGYIDVEFTETITDPGKEPVTNNYYFKGYFETPVK